MKKTGFILLMCLILIFGVTGCNSSETAQGDDKVNTGNENQPVNQNDSEAVDEEQVTDAIGTYVTVTESYDWGPAISKVLINVGKACDLESVDKDDFKVTSIRTYKAFDFTTNSMPDEATRNEVERSVTDMYMSDDKGNPSPSGTYLALEMPVGPALVEGSPYNYDFTTGRNDFVETTYSIQYNGGNLTGTDGSAVALSSVEESQFENNVNVIADSFNNNQPFEYEGISLLYADYIPETASDEAGTNPLIIWLHGAGEGGTNTLINIMGNKVVNLATDTVQSYFGDTGAYVLAPQAPTMWMDFDGKGTYNNSVESSDGHSYYSEALMALIKDYVAQHPEIDTSRIYLGGCSNGGYMTVNMAIQNPDYFAAIYPICEAYDVSWLTEDRVNALKDLPVWLTASKDDGTVAIYKGEASADFMSYNLELDSDGNPIPLDNFSNALYNRLIKAGSQNVHYSLFDKVVDTSGLYKDSEGNPYQYMGHWSWIYALNNECTDTVDGQEITLFEWLSEQNR